MPHVSRIKLKKETEEKLTNTLEDVFTHLKNPLDTKFFINSLLTETEKLMLAKRLAIALLVKQGLNDSEIASTLHLTRITVSRMRFFYEGRGKKGFDIAIKKLEELQMLEDFKKMLMSLAGYTVRASGGYIKL